MKAPRSFGSSGFSGSKFKEQEDVDPRVGLVNLADVMLVFACGLMLALVVHWNVNVTTVTQMDEQDMTEIDQNNVENMANEMQGGNSYNELGMVYQDPTTGKMYLLEEGDKKSDKKSSKGDSESKEESGDSEGSEGSEGSGK